MQKMKNSLVCHGLPLINSRFVLSWSPIRILNKTIVLELFLGQENIWREMVFGSECKKKNLFCNCFLSASHFKNHLFWKVCLVHMFKTLVFSHGSRVQSWQTICSVQVFSSVVLKHLGFVIFLCRRTLQDSNGRTG